MNHPFDRAHYYRPDRFPERPPSWARVILEWALILGGLGILFGISFLMMFTDVGRPIQ